MDKRFTCRKAAVLSDIHSNYNAFRACYEDSTAKGADLFIFLGDYISDLADPRKTLDLVYEIREKYPTVCLRGNRERYMLEYRSGKSYFSAGSKTGSLLYTYNQLQSRDLDFIEGLPIYDMVTLNNVSFEIAHGTKEDDRYYFDGTDVNTEAVLAQMKYRYLLVGHCHRQYIRRSGEKVILNPGSIGVPRDHGFLTQYAMIEFADQNVHFELCQIPYNVPAMIHRQFESGLMNVAPHWAISVLYDAITGREYTMELLNRLKESEIYDEQTWHCIATEMGMKFTEEEITDFYKQLSSSIL